MTQISVDLTLKDDSGAYSSHRLYISAGKFDVVSFDHIDNIAANPAAPVVVSISVRPAAVSSDGASPSYRHVGAYICDTNTTVDWACYSQGLQALVLFDPAE